MTDERRDELLPEGEVLRINEWEAAGKFFIGGAVVVIGLAYVFAKHGPYHDVPRWLVPLLGLVLVGIGIQLVASSRSGLIVEQSGIIVQGSFRRRGWAWSQVSRFELTGAIYGLPMRIQLADGKQLRVPGFRTRSRGQRELAQERVAELNLRMESAQRAAVT
jgi:hypothetical protein